MKLIFVVIYLTMQSNYQDAYMYKEIGLGKDECQHKLFQAPIGSLDKDNDLIVVAKCIPINLPL